MSLKTALRNVQYVVIDNDFVYGYGDDIPPMVVCTKNVYKLPKAIVTATDYIDLLSIDPGDVKQVRRRKGQIEITTNNESKIVLQALKKKIPKRIQRRLYFMQSMYSNEPFGYISETVLHQLYEIMDENSTVLLEEDKLVCLTKSGEHKIYLQFDEEDEPLETYVRLPEIIYYYRPISIDIYEDNWETVVILKFNDYVIYWFYAFETDD